MVKEIVTKKKAAAPRKRVASAVKKPKGKKPASVVAGAAVVAKPRREAHRYYFATGRRKTAVATIRLFAGQQPNQVNQKPFTGYFVQSYYQQLVLQPFVLTATEDHYHFTAVIRGGGIHAQAKALQHALSQALVEANAELRLVLKKNGLLTRDDRKKERKKPGLKRARRAPQWAKR